jgi:hypothetical protein
VCELERKHDLADKADIHTRGNSHLQMVLRKKGENGDEVRRNFCG